MQTNIGCTSTVLESNYFNTNKSDHFSFAFPNFDLHTPVALVHINNLKKCVQLINISYLRHIAVVTVM